MTYAADGSANAPAAGAEIAGLVPPAVKQRYRLNLDGKTRVQVIAIGAGTSTATYRVSIVCIPYPQGGYF